MPKLPRDMNRTHYQQFIAITVGAVRFATGEIA
jgi:hypothetical protein